jgi:hypothetical protein
VRIFDAHLHTGWDDAGRAGELLGELDAAGYAGALVISPICEWAPGGASAEVQRRSVDFIADFAAADRSRLLPFAHVAPQLPGAADAVRRARDRGCLGLKMLPNHWYPYDEEVAFPVYRAAEECGLPILFHSGILWAFEDSSRFCRPVFFEALLHFPKVRFALAHIGWPWTDECLAVWGRLEVAARQAGREPQMFIDCTPGTPRFYRSEAIDRAVRYCSCDWLIFGSDGNAGWKAAQFVEAFRRDREILADELSLPAAEQEKFFGGNLLRFVGGKLGAGA